MVVMDVGKLADEDLMENEGAYGTGPANDQP